jgi:hypothetical protein
LELPLFELPLLLAVPLPPPAWQEIWMWQKHSFVAHFPFTKIAKIVLQ